MWKRTKSDWLCLNLKTLKPGGGGGGTCHIHDREVRRIFLGVENLHPRNFFGSRDLSRIFLGLKVCLIE